VIAALGDLGLLDVGLSSDTVDEPMLSADAA
jgi:hypothetical protein